MPIKETLHNGDIVEILTQKNQTPKGRLALGGQDRQGAQQDQGLHPRGAGQERAAGTRGSWNASSKTGNSASRSTRRWGICANITSSKREPNSTGLIATEKIDLSTVKEILTRWQSGEADEERRAAAAAAEQAKLQNAAARPAHSTDALVIDDNINQIEYKLAKCCNPIKGDDIFGFVTISSGITIHRTDCPNARRMRENYPYRVIDARWRQTAEGAFRVTIRIVAADTTGMANHITETVIRDLKLNIRSMNLASRGGLLTGTVDVEVPATSVVDTLVHAILRIKGVQKAFRTNG